MPRKRADFSADGFSRSVRSMPGYPGGGVFPPGPTWAPQASRPAVSPPSPTCLAPPALRRFACRALCIAAIPAPHAACRRLSRPGRAVGAPVPAGRQGPVHAAPVPIALDHFRDTHGCAQHASDETPRRQHRQYILRSVEAVVAAGGPGVAGAGLRGARPSAHAAGHGPSVPSDTCTRDQVHTYACVPRPHDPGGGPEARVLRLRCVQLVLLGVSCQPEAKHVLRAAGTLGLAGEQPWVKIDHRQGVC